jgi:hypothetical protein
MAFTWFNRMIRDRRPGVRKQESRAAHRLGRRPRLGFDVLEGRCVPAVGVVSGTAGPDGFSIGATTPPDTQVAYGPTATLAVYSLGVELDSIGGHFAAKHADLSTPLPLAPTYFPRSGSIASVYSDPFVVYDDNIQRFIFGELETDNVLMQSFVHFTISDDSTPTSLVTSFSEVHSINITENGSVAGDPLFGANPNIGFNADGIFLSFNMESFINSGRFDHTQILAFDAKTLSDADPGTIFFQPVGTPGFNRPAPFFGMVPAREHNASPGTPEYFVNTYGQQLETGATFSSTAIQVSALSNYFSVNPGLVTTTLTVPNFGSSTGVLNAITTNVSNSGISPSIIEPDNTGHGTTIIGLDTQIVSAAWQNNTLVAAHTAIVNNQETATWYQISTASPQTAALVQTANIPQSPGVYTYAPSIDVANNGDIGMTYGQSSAIQFPSVYVVGRNPSDPVNRMEAAVEVKAGETTLGAPSTAAITPIVPTPQPFASSTDPTNWFNTFFFFPYAFMTSQLVDRSGMTPAAGTGGTQSNLPFDAMTGLGTMWRTDPNGGATAVMGATLDFNFGTVVSLNSVHIWNYNDTYAAATDVFFNPDMFVGTQFGVKGISFETSTDGINWGQPIQTSTIPRANGTNNDPGATVTFGIPIFTQYLRFLINSNYTATGTTGVVGLSEVQFFQNPPQANRVGEKSLIQVDPLNPNTFAASNAYAKNVAAPIENWGAWISLFRVSAPVTQSIAGIAPVRWLLNPATGLFVGTYSLSMNTPTITAAGGQLFATIILPDASLIASGVVGAVQVGNLYEIPLIGTLTTGQVFKFTVSLADPLKVSLPTSISNNTIFVS